MLSKQDNYFQIAYEYIITLENKINNNINMTNNLLGNNNINNTSIFTKQLFFSSLLLRDKLRF